MTISTPNINAYDQGAAGQPLTTNVNLFDQGAAQQPEISYYVVKVSIQGIIYDGCLVKTNMVTNVSWIVLSREDNTVYEVYPCTRLNRLDSGPHYSLAPIPSASFLMLDKALQFALEAASV